MFREIKISNFRQVTNLTAEANKQSDDICVHDFRGSIADAKSILGLMSLDYTRPVKIFTDNETALRACVYAITI